MSVRGYGPELSIIFPWSSRLAPRTGSTFSAMTLGGQQIIHLIVNSKINDLYDVCCMAGMGDWLSDEHTMYHQSLFIVF